MAGPVSFAFITSNLLEEEVTCGVGEEEDSSSSTSACDDELLDMEKGEQCASVREGHLHREKKAEKTREFFDVVVIFLRLRERTKSRFVLTLPVAETYSALYVRVAECVGDPEFGIVCYTLLAGPGGVPLVNKILLGTEKVSDAITLVYCNELPRHEQPSVLWTAVYSMVMFPTGRPALALVPFVLPGTDLSSESELLDAISLMLFDESGGRSYVRRQLLASLVVSNGVFYLFRFLSTKRSGKIRDVAMVLSAPNVGDVVQLRLCGRPVAVVRKVYFNRAFVAFDVVEVSSNIPHFGLTCLDILPL